MRFTKAGFRKYLRQATHRCTKSDPRQCVVADYLRYMGAEMPVVFGDTYHLLDKAGDVQCEEVPLPKWLIRIVNAFDKMSGRTINATRYRRELMPLVRT